MIRRALMIAVVGALVAPAVAHGLTLTTPEGEAARWEQRTLRRSPITLRHLDLDVTIRRDCPGVAGLYEAGERAICVNRYYADDPAVLMHEVWHLADFELGNVPAWRRFRAWFLRLHDVRRADGTLRRWDEPIRTYASGYHSSAAEWFAEAAALCSLPRREWREVALDYDFAPTRWRLTRTCRRLTRVTPAAATVALAGPRPTDWT